MLFLRFEGKQPTMFWQILIYIPVQYFSSSLNTNREKLARYLIFLLHVHVAKTWYLAILKRRVMYPGKWLVQLYQQVNFHSHVII